MVHRYMAGLFSTREPVISANVAFSYGRQFPLMEEHDHNGHKNNFLKPFDQHNTL